MMFPQKLKIKLLLGSAIHLLDICPQSGILKSHLYSHVHSSIVHDSQGTSTPSVHLQMKDKDSEHQGVLFSFKKEGGAQQGTCLA